MKRTRKWKLEGKLHRDGDLPAIIYAHGTREWWKNGKKHRDGDLPAVEYNDGLSGEWWKDGNLHRDGDLPAIVYMDGKRIRIQEWFKKGIRHRDGDLPAVWNNDGNHQWWRNGIPYFPDKEKELKRYEEQIREEELKKFEHMKKNMNKCIICWENKAIIAYIPCGHVFACDACSKQIEKNECSICRQKPINKIRVFY